MAISRRVIREKVMQVLYAYEISEEPIDKISSEIFEEVKTDIEGFKFANLIISKFMSNKNEVDEIIKSYVSNWEFERLAIIDKIVLRIALSEFLYFPDIPPKVTINEAIEIVKKFSTEKSGQFVNGILDTILNKMKQDHTIEKQGRGLIDQRVNKKPKNE
jgi:transcription antitermination protein NusB